MTLHLGSFNTSSSRTHVRFQFSTHAAAGGNVAPSSAFEAADIRIYRANDGAAFSATQRSSANGITMTSPFDSLTGVHDVDIDLTDNTDAGFYAAGYTYSVVLSPDETVDGQTITGVVLAMFEIGMFSAIADALLSRNVSNVEASAAEHTMATIILALLESSLSATTWTIKRTDGSTTHATKTVTTDPNAEPVTGVS